MRDYNYFNSYIKVPEKKRHTGFIFGFLLALIVILAGVYMGTLITTQIQYKAQLIKYNNYIQSEAVKEDLSRVSQKKQALEQLKENYGLIEDATKELDHFRVVNQDYVRKITSVLPSGTFLSYINGDSDNLSVGGFTQDYNDISQYQYNLKVMLDNDEVFVNTINKDEYRYFFSVDISHEEVAVDEN